MFRFPKQITPEFFEYSHTGSVADLKEKLEALASRTRGFNISPNLLVKLSAGNEFTVINKFELGTFESNPFHTSTTLKGYYFKSSLNTTQVNLLVSPHSLFPLLFLGLPIFFLVALFTEISDKQNFSGACLLIVLCMVATSVGLLFLSAFSKKRLLDRFVQYMELTKIA